MRFRLRRGALLAPAVVVLAGCGPVGVPLPGAQGSPITLGAVLSLSGSQARDGRSVREGDLLCQRWLNDRGGIQVAGRQHPLKLEIKDDAGRLSRSVALTDQLIDRDDLRLLLGPSNDAATTRDAPIVDAERVVMVHSTGISEHLLDRHLTFVFGVLAPAAQQMRGTIDMALAHYERPRTVAIIHANDTLSTEIAGEARDYASNRGMTIAAFVPYPSSVNDLRSPLKTAGASDPDLLLEIGHPTEAVLTMRTARALNLRPRLFGFAGDPGRDGLIAGLQKTAEGIVGETQWTAAARTRPGPFLSNQEYVTAFTARFGHPPDARSAAATAACFTLATAIQRAHSVDPARVRAALARLQLDTFFGQIRFDERGANIAKSNPVVQVQNGKPVVVWPAELGTVFPRYPWPGWRP